MIDENQILDAVGKIFGVTPKGLKSKIRTQRVALARQVVMYLLRNENRMSTIEIGEFLNRDHSTVIHGSRMIAARIAKDTAFAMTIAELTGYVRVHVIPWEQRGIDEQGCMA